MPTNEQLIVYLRRIGACDESIQFVQRGGHTTIKEAFFDAWAEGHHNWCGWLSTTLTSRIVNYEQVGVSSLSTTVAWQRFQRNIARERARRSQLRARGVTIVSDRKDLL